MADLDPLIRVRKHSVEQKQKFLAELYRQADEMQRQKEVIEQQVQSERAALEGMNSVEMLAAFSAFAEAAKIRIADIDDSMKKLNVRIEIAREDMREAFSDLKKIEITQERREAEEFRLLEKRQMDLLDEVALEGFRRKVEEE
jgi:flagellar export protein FliJ